MSVADTSTHMAAICQFKLHITCTIITQLLVFSAHYSLAVKGTNIACMCTLLSLLYKDINGRQDSNTTPGNNRTIQYNPKSEQKWY